MLDKSKGHIAFIEDQEYFIAPNGNLYKAYIGNVIDLHTGLRTGARFEAPAHLIDHRLHMLMSQAWWKQGYHENPNSSILIVVALCSLVFLRIVYGAVK